MHGKPEQMRPSPANGAHVVENLAQPLLDHLGSHEALLRPLRQSLFSCISELDFRGHLLGDTVQEHDPRLRQATLMRQPVVHRVGDVEVRERRLLEDGVGGLVGGAGAGDPGRDVVLDDQGDEGGTKVFGGAGEGGERFFRFDDGGRGGGVGDAGLLDVALGAPLAAGFRHFGEVGHCEDGAWVVRWVRVVSVTPGCRCCESQEFDRGE